MRTHCCCHQRSWTPNSFDPSVWWYFSSIGHKSTGSETENIAPVPTLEKFEGSWDEFEKVIKATDDTQGISFRIILQLF